MSIVLSTAASTLRTKAITKLKHGEPKTSSILLISISIFIGIIVLMYSGLMYTETMMKEYSVCRDKIVGFEQDGMYSSSEQFKLAVSYCNVR